MCKRLPGRCADDCGPRHNLYGLVEIKLAGTPELQTHTRVHAAQVQPAIHVRKFVGVAVKYLDQRCARVCVPAQAQDNYRARRAYWYGQRLLQRACPGEEQATIDIEYRHLIAS